MKIILEKEITQPLDAEIVFLLSSTKKDTTTIPFSSHHTEALSTACFHSIDHTPVLTVGLGEEGQLNAEMLRDAAGKAIREAVKEQWTSLGIRLPHVLSEDIEVRAVIEGLRLGAYRMDKYKKAKTIHTVDTVRIEVTTDAVTTRTGDAMANAAIIARNLSNEPPNFLRPSVLAEFVVQHFQGTDAKVEVWDETRLEQENMAGILAVGKGSVHKPRFIVIRYQSDTAKDLIALVGKGITFDTGGISLKSGRDISNMRMDMAGAAAVIGALDALVTLGVKCNVLGLIAAAENIPDAGSMLPGELIAYRNGLSVQVGNTDAEGRLVLADALLYAGEQGAQQIVDIATLTGSAANALGKRYAAIFGDDEVVSCLTTAGAATGDYVWRLPLVDEYEGKLRSVYADLCNIGGTQAGAIIAALFLRRFVSDGSKWAHVDMAGPMEQDETHGYRVAGATGYGARLLAEYVLAKVSG